ncbi:MULTISPECIES: hypothetical protein [unclassified Moorena]|nr:MULTISPECIES: hypothetical protein [unclassified Moorena]NER90080.1 hypothetical protein [Moorena sp. SIO3A2]NES42956.1 hypothetical protein [Moorena sp. SIO2C4]
MNMNPDEIAKLSEFADPTLRNARFTPYFIRYLRQHFKYHRSCDARKQE